MTVGREGKDTSGDKERRHEEDRRFEVKESR